jgi:hypothetical protein
MCLANHLVRNRHWENAKETASSTASVLPVKSITSPIPRKGSSVITPQRGQAVGAIGARRNGMAWFEGVRMIPAFVDDVDDS